MFLRRWLRIMLANLYKDLRIWLRQWKNILYALALPCTFIAVAWLGSAALSTDPVALVVLDRGKAAEQLTQAIESSNALRVSQVSDQQAHMLYRQLKVGAIITIPSGFSQTIAQHRRMPIPIQVNNLNSNFTHTIRTAVPGAIITYYNNLGTDSPIKVSIVQQHLHPQNITIFQFSVLPMITLLLMTGGLISSGTATAREWEDLSIKEILCSPAYQTAVVIGKILAGSLSTFCLGLFLLAVGYIFNWLRPQGEFLLTALLAIALIAMFAAGLGFALGTLIRRVQVVLMTSSIASLWLFFPIGGIGVLQFEPDWLKQIAMVDPLTYGTHALQMAIFYQSFDRLGLDLAILALSTLTVTIVGIYAMRR